MASTGTNLLTLPSLFTGGTEAQKIMIANDQKAQFAASNKTFQESLLAANEPKDPNAWRAEGRGTKTTADDNVTPMDGSFIATNTYTSISVNGFNYIKPPLANKITSDQALRALSNLAIVNSPDANMRDRVKASSELYAIGIVTFHGNKEITRLNDVRLRAQELQERKENLSLKLTELLATKGQTSEADKLASQLEGVSILAESALIEEQFYLDNLDEIAVQQDLGLDLAVLGEVPTSELVVLTNDRLLTAHGIITENAAISATGETMAESPKSLKAKVTKLNSGPISVNMTVLNSSTPAGDSQKKDENSLPPDYYRDGRIVEQPPDTTKGETEIKRVYAPIPRALEGLGLNDNYKKDSICTIRAISGVGTADQPHRNLVPAFLKFFLTGVTAPRSERYQIVETFGDWYIFFYGERPAVYTFSGVLLNSLNYNWLNEFDFFYDAFLRGTAATRNVSRIFITYGVQQVQGHLLNFTHSIDSSNDMAVNFQLSMAVVKRFALSPDYGNRVTDSFITNFETVEAFQKLIDKDKKRKYNYSMLANIMKGKNKPANADPSAKKEVVADLTKRINKIGFDKPYDSEKEFV